MTHLPDPDTQPEFYENVPLKRLLAWLVDTVIIVVLCVVILPFTAFTGLFFFPFLLLMVGFAYRVITLANGSATWGMRLMAIELRDGRDRPFDLGLAVLHTLGYTLSIGTAIVQVVSIVLMASSARGQGLTDMFLNTTALNRRRLR
ncbi:MAG: RDD family protein [Sulfitobacter sp.]